MLTGTLPHDSLVVQGTSGAILLMPGRLLCSQLQALSPALSPGLCGVLACPCCVRCQAETVPLQALILSERLQAVGSSFDRCRSVRYQQLLQQQRQLQQKKQRLNAIQVI